ncbi:ATP-binding protein [Acrocarpospora corrugata]|uniref:ATP-binding protein n=1 Tax=Acrocarpospora corrugata TaxID=35763 RepID=A0A5M3W8N8_9ACTN|nr:DUF2075 domain-containing protein [Acrocarpospora corrugata]GES04600.1 ATP-binding protein [Acrocarpospora corrugata]
MENTLLKKLAENVKRQRGQAVRTAEKKAWLHSLSEFVRVLDDAGLGAVEVLVEFPMPHCKLSSADVVLAGVHPVTRADAYVVVELKQWGSATAVDADADLFEVPGLPPKSHPAEQVLKYRNQIANNFGALDGHPEAVKAVVYLHNATHTTVGDLLLGAAVEGVPLFTSSERGGLIEYLRRNLADEPGHLSADRLLQSPIRPNQHFLRKAADVIRGVGQFDLLDQQLDAYNLVNARTRLASQANTKRVVIIVGGPGSGKSAIALSLVREHIRQNNRVAYATGSRTVTKTLRQHVARKDAQFEGFFRYFMEFANSKHNGLDLLIADEAHRVRKNSSDRFRAEWRSNDPQIKSIINAAHVPVFLLDEHQVVKPDEVGTVAAIIAQAQALDVAYDVIRLDGQWRCGGSAVYDQWVLDLLGLGPSDGEWNGGIDPEKWPGDPNFDVVLANSPEDMEEFLRAKLSDGLSARMTAGFCWPWSDPNPDKTLIPDVILGTWARPWNAKTTRDRIGSAPSSHYWATADGGFEQIGCVYTAQGLEFDWVGVIIGPDLVARAGKFVPRREYSRDKDLIPARVTYEQFGRHVRNVYKVLLTRGLRGVVIYAADPETREFLAALINA